MAGNAGGLVGMVLRGALKRCFPGYWRGRQDREEMRAWIAMGRPPRPPQVVKSQVVRDNARKFSTAIMIETGTYRGDMVEACRKSFRHIYSIELSEELYESARQRFSSLDRVTILQGDSAQVLPGLLARIGEPCLFWLDAHYSGGVTAQGRVLTPIFDELERILAHPVPGHVILIDDACDFVGTEGYPTIAELRVFVHTHRPGWVFEVRDDIIRIHG
jgi:hypothetical protein